MLNGILAFILGFAIPFIAGRLGKILPATTGLILFQLPHRPHFPNVHNPLQHRTLKRKWKKLLFYALLMGGINLCLWTAVKIYLPVSIHLYAYAFIWILLCAADTDMRYCLLPDCLTIPLLLLGFLFAVQTNMISPLHSIIGGIFAYLITVLSVFVLSLRKRTIFGGGDSKMAIAMGTWLGIQGLNYTIFTSFFIFVLHSFMIKKTTAPYGLALGIAGIISFFLIYTK